MDTALDNLPNQTGAAKPTITKPSIVNTRTTDVRSNSTNMCKNDMEILKTIESIVPSYHYGSLKAYNISYIDISQDKLLPFQYFHRPTMESIRRGVCWKSLCCGLGLSITAFASAVSQRMH